LRIRARPITDRPRSDRETQATVTCGMLSVMLFAAVDNRGCTSWWTMDADSRTGFTKNGTVLGLGSLSTIAKQRFGNGLVRYRCQPGTWFWNGRIDEAGAYSISAHRLRKSQILSGPHWKRCRELGMKMDQPHALATCFHHTHRVVPLKSLLAPLYFLLSVCNRGQLDGRTSRWRGA